jgi:glycine cleavage system transcriptional repressor
MKKHMVLFSIGSDRPGIVDDVSTRLFELGANILDSRMTVMGGCFSIMTLFSYSSEQLEAIKKEMTALEKLGLKSYLHEAQDPETIPKRTALPLNFEVTSVDHPGILQEVVHCLRLKNANIESLVSQMTCAPFSGAPLFHLSVEAAVPAENPIAEVKEELLTIAAKMNLDLNFQN